MAPGERNGNDEVDMCGCATEPNPDDAVEAKIADQYRNDRAAYEREAREWVKRYATGKK